MEAVHTRTFKALCQFYEPFTMGGRVNQWVHYEVEGVEVLLRRNISGFICKRPDGVFSVHEKDTGGYLGEGASELEAEYDANHNIDITEDLEEQIKSIAAEAAGAREVSADDAYGRLKHVG